MVKLIKAIILSIVGIGIGIGLFQMLIIGLDRSARSECYKWQEQALQYRGFYLTKSEAEQCNEFNIKVEAPVL